MTDFNDKKLQEIYERAEKEALLVDKKTAQKFGADIDWLYSMSTRYRRTSVITFGLPNIYAELGKRFNIPVSDHCLLRKDTLHKILGEKEGKKDIAHALSKSEVKGLLNQLANPIMVVETVQNGKATLVSVLKLKNEQEHLYQGFIHIDKEILYGEKFSDLASVYAKKNLTYWLEKKEYNVDKRIIYVESMKELSRILPYDPSQSMGGESRPGTPAAEVIHPSLMHKNILTRSEFVNQRLIDHLTFLTLGIETNLNSDKAKAFQEKHTKTPTNELLKEIHSLEKLKGRLPKMPKQQSNTLARIKAKTKDGITK